MNHPDDPHDELRDERHDGELARMHGDVLASVSRELDGVLNDGERTALAAHLAGCARCATVAAQLRAAGRAIRIDARARPPVGLVERTLARIARDGARDATVAHVARVDREAPLAPAAARSPLRVLRASAAIAAALLVLLGSVYVALGPRHAVASTVEPLRSRDAELNRVLERWHGDRDAAPGFFELLLAPAAK